MTFNRRVDVFGWIILAFLVLFVALPILTVFLWAFAEQWFYPAILPTKWGLKYWYAVLGRPEVWAAFVTSLQLSTIVTALSALICLPAAYAFARMNFPGKAGFMMSFLMANAFPRFALIISIAVLFLSMNLVGTYSGVVIIQLLNTLLLMIWLPTAAFRAVSREMEEAARDVGAGPFRVFWSITLPQALPTIAAALLMTFVWTFYETEGAWLVGAPRIRTMPLLMMSMINNQLVVQYGAVLSVMLWVPSLAAILLARRVIGGDAFAKGLGG
ncbi:MULTISPECIES: ABC transporter permease [Rhizobium]|uniref:ABC transporter permease subunit n=1 Tax=Rhizobium rhododendri TaxID=2506430 RepID=A0ABY8IPH6_9HYPH|nr:MULTISPECIES: ABC transporter permease subunit [Rhizobium]MBO9101078.1 ABC transporter permease subunit [Rhizobium sp. L58/93]MBO9135363.1 ABC transporter permease subunit [Rhizobium sp. B209b/85]MBO9171588.1 ABC transporter permease subunit [Rhizobium sp. L245/93]MBO9186666.1 ABC transporter permease subunit [Rhizobium sp. E27B/91]MBZ5762424.1 ABC transporter permease subunit [Rhizobium sp. VS19-DR96]